MKKHKIFIATLLVSGFLFTGISYGQTSDESGLSLATIGIGLHAEQYKISDIFDSYYSAYTSTVLVPINLTQHFRLEPEIGMMWMKNKDDDKGDIGISSGLGIFGMFQRGKVNIYAGGRLLLDKAKVNDDYYYNGDYLPLKYTRFKVGPSFGFEYFLAKNFCIGGEIGVRYAFAKSLIEIPNADDEEDSATTINFDSGLFIRLFF